MKRLPSFLPASLCVFRIRKSKKQKEEVFVLSCWIGVMTCSQRRRIIPVAHSKGICSMNKWVAMQLLLVQKSKGFEKRVCFGYLFVARV